MDQEPQGELAIRILAMPENTNPMGHIFGGWIISLMDLAGLSIASGYAPYRCVTAAIDSMVFITPVEVGDFVCCYARIKKLGRTSMHITIETWAVGTQRDSQRRKVTEGTFVFVSVDKHGKPVPLRADESS